MRRIEQMGSWVAVTEKCLVQCSINLWKMTWGIKLKAACYGELQFKNTKLRHVAWEKHFWVSFCTHSQRIKTEIKSYAKCRPCDTGL